MNKENCNINAILLTNHTAHIQTSAVAMGLPCVCISLPRLRSDLGLILHMLATTQSPVFPTGRGQAIYSVEFCHIGVSS